MACTIMHRRGSSQGYKCRGRRGAGLAFHDIPLRRVPRVMGSYHHIIFAAGRGPRARARHSLHYITFHFIALPYAGRGAHARARRRQRSHQPRRARVPARRVPVRRAKCMRSRGAHRDVTTHHAPLSPRHRPSTDRPVPPSPRDRPFVVRSIETLVRSIDRSTVLPRSRSAAARSRVRAPRLSTPTTDRARRRAAAAYALHLAFPSTAVTRVRLAPPPRRRPIAGP